jgi:hypothetical protein
VTRLPDPYQDARQPVYSKPSTESPHPLSPHSSNRPAVSGLYIDNASVSAYGFDLNEEDRENASVTTAERTAKRRQAS